MPSPPSPRTFFDRSWGGLSYGFWIALVATLLIALVPRGARRAIESNTNKAEDWLPPSYQESADLAWFRQHFDGGQFVLVSWEGCTLDDTAALATLQDRLRETRDPDGWAWYPRLVSGPDTIASLVQAPALLSRSAAMRRLEGALVGPPQRDSDGVSLGDGSRTTCLLAYLAPQLTTNNRQMRQAVDQIETIVHQELGIPLAAIHMGGPPVDNITIDKEGERTLMRLAGLAGLVGLVLAYVCFRSWKLTSMVFFTAVVSAGMSLALVFYYGAFEVLALGMPTSRLGKVDAILMSMPAVVYVLALSGAIHLVNYYRDARRDHGLPGAAERSVGAAWGPCLLAALTTAIGLGSLAASDILPIRKFGLFTAVGVIASVGLLFAILPILLHRFAPADRAITPRRREGSPWHERLSQFVTTRHRLTTSLCLAAMLLLAVGLTRTQTSVQLLKLLDEQCDLVTDYAWLEQHLGNLVPMEVILPLEADQLRSPDEPSDTGPRYRMTMAERTQLLRQLQEAIESLPAVSRVLAATTFSPEPATAPGSASMRRGAEYTTSMALEASRSDLGEYLQTEQPSDDRERELWRLSARVTALGDIDYGQFVRTLRDQIDPILAPYRARDQIIAQLDDAGRSLHEAKILLLHAGAERDTRTKDLATLLRRGAVRRVTVLDTEQYQQADATTRAKIDHRLTQHDLLATFSDEVANTFTTPQGDPPHRLTLDEAGDSFAPVYTGIVPVVYKTQRELLASLQQSILLATVVIAGVMVLVLRSPAAGIVSMLPNLFPIVVVFGAIGWLGVKVDIGIMMTASVALGVAVDDTLHFVTWFRRGIRQGLDRRSATRLAYDRCATAMLQTTLIAGLGLAVFAVSTFTPTQQFGCLMVTMLATALVGDLILLPALLCGPLGRFFAPGVPAVALGAVAPSAKPAPPAEPPAASPAAPPAALLRFESPSPQTEELTPTNEALRSKLRRFRSGSR